MASKKKEKKYSLQEIKETFFPNRDLESLKEQDDIRLSKESFDNIIKKTIPAMDGELASNQD